MQKKKSYITVKDLFCGAGGSSQGARNAGAEVKYALNHWQQAIDTHNTNFPDTAHDCCDISASDPRRYHSTDILIASPECTTHSPAGGNTHKQHKKQMDLFATGKIDPATERSRATMWDVCRFAEYHSYNAIIVENVVEALTRWALFDVWIAAMHKLGYMHRLCFHNSMHHHPTPQSRDRMYIVFWKKGNKAPMLDFMPAAYCPKCEKNVAAVQTWKKHNVRYGKYRQQYVYCCPNDGQVVEPYYHAAFNCIDWTDLGQRIGDRKKPLVKNTIDRIQYGLDKYGNKPLTITTRYSSGTDCRIKVAADSPLPAQPGDYCHGVLTPFVVDDKQYSGIGCRVRGLDGVISPVLTEPRFKLCSPPFLIRQEHTHGHASGKVKSATEPYQTQTTSMSSGIVVPYIVRNQTPGNCKPATGSIGAITTDDTHALLTPFIPVARGKSKANSSLDAISTQSTMIHDGICTPPLITELQGTGKARPVTKELNGVTAGGIHSGLVTSESWNSFLSSYYGGSHCLATITEVAGTMKTKDTHAIINYQQPAIEDCYYRMLKPHEIKLAMAFGNDYIVLGNAKDQVKQLGNAVTPPAMEWLIKQVIATFN